MGRNERYPIDFFDLEEDVPDEFDMTNENWRNFKVSSELPVKDPSKNLMEYILFQDHVVDIVKRIADSGSEGIRRHLLMIGLPGTGKSLIAEALAQEIDKRKSNSNSKKETIDDYLGDDAFSREEVINKWRIPDVISIPNKKVPSNPIIRYVPPGTGGPYIEELQINAKRKAERSGKALVAGVSIWESLVGYYAVNSLLSGGRPLDVMFLISMLGFTPLFLYIFWNRFGGVVTGGQTPENKMPKLLIDNSELKTPFIDATGAGSQVLFGSIQHDPYQSGGLGTPQHARLEPGLIHRANGGVLFIDEVASVFNANSNEKTLRTMLTVLEDEKYAIQHQGTDNTGSGAFNVQSEPLPCRFMLVAGGNLDNYQNLHSALRDRLQSYGYEIYMNSTADYTPQNKRKIARFVEQKIRLQEWKKGEKFIPFARDAIIEVVYEALERGGGKELTVQLRSLGGLVMAANDVAFSEKSAIVLPEHVKKGKIIQSSIEQQIFNKEKNKIEKHSPVLIEGSCIGRVNSLFTETNADRLNGYVMPIEAKVISGSGQIIATGGLEKTAVESVHNSAAIIKHLAEDYTIGSYDIYLQYIQSKTVESDSSSVDHVVAILSDLLRIPVKQYVAMTGSHTVRGHILSVSGVDAKIKAAQSRGIKQVIIPEINYVEDINPEVYNNIEILTARTIFDYCDKALVWRLEDERQRAIYLKLKQLDAELKGELSIEKKLNNTLNDFI